MNLNNGLKSTHDLKKCSYRMLRKMHSLEARGSLRECPKLNNEYYVVLCLQHMADIMGKSYTYNANAKDFALGLEELIKVLQMRTQNGLRVNRSILVACLKTHTRVFNWLEDNKIRIKADDALSELWNMKCVVAYVCQFGNRI